MKSGWKQIKLGEVCGFQNGFAFKSNLFTETGHPILRISNIQDEEIETRRVVYFQLKDYKENLDKYRVVTGDLLIAMSGGTTGKIGFNTTDQLYYLNQRVGKFEPKDCLLKQYLFYFLLTRVEENLRISAGSAQPNLSTEQIKDFDIPLPPIPEQQRIVGILDAAFEGIATAKANTEKNLQNACALFESYLQSVFNRCGKDWVDTTLEAEIDLLAGFAFKSAQYTDSIKDIRLLRGDNIIQGCLRWDDVKRWPSSDTDAYGHYQLHEGDVVLAMDRPWVNAGLKHAIISVDDLPCLLVQRTARLRGRANMDNRFLMYLIGSEAFISHILGVQTGIGVPHISGQQIKDFRFLMPPITEQRIIVIKLDLLKRETQRLASIYEQKLRELEALKKSLLNQAFNGDLR